MPRPRKPDVFQLAVATRSYSSVDGYRKEIDILKNELAQTRQRLDGQARDFAREREDLQRQLRMKRGAASPERGGKKDDVAVKAASPERVVKSKTDKEAQRWEARCAALAAQRALYDAARSLDERSAREYASKVASELAKNHEKLQRIQMERLGALDGRVGAAAARVRETNEHVAAARRRAAALERELAARGDAQRIDELERELAAYRQAQKERFAYENALEDMRDDAASAAFCAAADDALRQARLHQAAANERDALKLSNARLASIEAERDAAEDSVRRERGAVAELRAQLAELRRPGVSRGCQADEEVDDEPIVNAAVGAAAVKCREAVEEELRAAAAFAHLHDLLKVAALDAAAAVKEALESKLEASIEREKRLRLALAAAGGFEADEAGPSRRGARRRGGGGGRAPAGPAPAAKVAVDGARARAGGRARRRARRRRRAAAAAAGGGGPRASCSRRTSGDDDTRLNLARASRTWIRPMARLRLRRRSR